MASVQNRRNRGEREDGGLVGYTANRSMAFIPYGPRGAKPMQQGAGLAPAEALAWLLRRSDNIIVIPGTTSVAHLEDNVRAWEQM